MTTEIRTVFELLPRSAPRQAFNLAAAVGQLLLSEATLAELDEVLRRPKFDKYASEPRRLEFLLSLVDLAEVVPVTQKIVVCLDPKDDKFLELAVAGRASHIISGDNDLLALHPFQGIAIVTAKEFMATIVA